MSLQTGVHYEPVKRLEGGGAAAFPLLSDAADDCVQGTGFTRSHLGVGSMPLSGDRVDGIWAVHYSIAYVSSTSSVDSSKGLLFHEGRSAIEDDPPVTSSGPVVSGILVLETPSVSGNPSSITACLSYPEHGCVHLWMGGGVQSLVRLIWSRGKSYLYINSLQLESVFFVLKKFQRWLSGTHILVHTDNTTVMHYLSRMGGTGSGTRIILWCLASSSTLTAVHSSGCNNVEVYRLSHLKVQDPP